jgi:polar amino acid transport system substrate-binding protein
VSVLLMLFGLLLAMPTWALEELRLVTKHWPGYTNTDFSGGYFELVRLVLPPDRYQIKTEFSNFNRAVVLVQKEQADLVLAVTRVDGKQLLLSEFPIDADTVVALYHEKLALKTTTMHLAALPEYRLAWDLAYNYGQALGLTVDGYEVSGVSQGIELVNKGRVDVYLAERADVTGPEALKLLQRSKLKQSVIEQLPVYIGFSRSAKGLQLKRIWDQQFRLLMQQGTLQHFYQQYPGMVLATKVPVCAASIC